MGSKFGISFSFWRLIGVSSLKGSLAKATGIPTTKNGFNSKLGRIIMNFFLGR